METTSVDLSSIKTHLLRKLTLHKIQNKASRRNDLSLSKQLQMSVSDHLQLHCSQEVNDPWMCEIFAGFKIETNNKWMKGCP